MYTSFQTVDDVSFFIWGILLFHTNETFVSKQRNKTALNLFQTIEGIVVQRVSFIMRCNLNSTRG